MKQNGVCCNTCYVNMIRDAFEQQRGVIVVNGNKKKKKIKIKIKYCFSFFFFEINIDWPTAPAAKTGFIDVWWLVNIIFKYFNFNIISKIIF